MMIAKKDLSGLLDLLIKKYQVIAPVKEGAFTNFKNIGFGNQVDLTQSNTKLPPKGVLFPQSEKLFCYRTDQEGVHLEECRDDQEKVIFGIRPCDARSFVLLDNVFSGDKYQDPYYLGRRNKTILVGLGCNEPCATCFCASVGSGPFAAEGLDLLLIDTGDQYIVETISEKGKGLANYLSLPAADEAARNAAEKVKQEAMVTSTVNTSGLKGRLDVNFGDPLWDLIHEKCLGCAACTYVCPTCHCFDIVDEAKDADGCRVRNWDSCMFPLFTLHGSGHNPRPTGKERFRQRVMHKFKYFVDNYGAIACVGCGRCIKSCPVNVDIREVIDTVQKAGSEVG